VKRLHERGAHSAEDVSLLSNKNVQDLEKIRNRNSGALVRVAWTSKKEV